MIISEERHQFQATLRRFFSDNVSLEYIKKRLPANSASDEKLWNAIRELGLFEFLGTEGQVLDLAIIAQECGRCLLPENLIASLFLGAYLTSKLDEKDSKVIKEYLSKHKVELTKLQSGESQSAFYETFEDLKADTANVSFSHVAYASSSAIFGFPALNQGKSEAALAITAIQNDAKVKLSKAGGLDLTVQYSEVKLSSSEAFIVKSIPYIRVRLLNMVLRANELSGICTRVVELTTEYVKTRNQFGVPVGSFQAVQHKLADMHSQSEALRTLSLFSAWASDNSEDQLELSARAAITFAVEVAPKIVETAIQLHGGIGFTWEHEAHLFLRRVKSIEATYSGLSKEVEVDALIKAAQ